MSNTKKAATLGMPHGTATHRLRKNILFHLLKKHGENYCFKCNELIETVDDLSIEHKKPWEGISAELFWNLENIAFSHIRCQVIGKRSAGLALRKIGPAGTRWCYRCENFKSIDLFSKDSSDWTGLDSRCKTCRAEARQLSKPGSYNGSTALS